MKKVTLILLTLLFSTGLFAQAFDPGTADQGKPEPQPKQRSMKHGLWGRLNLTDDQKEKLRQIREADRESLRSAWAQVKIARETLKAALLADPENIADVEAKASNLANAMSTFQCRSPCIGQKLIRCSRLGSVSNWKSQQPVACVVGNGAVTAHKRTSYRSLVVGREEISTFLKSPKHQRIVKSLQLLTRQGLGP
jgi:Spy/CpxP family protein refolding chaperone